MQRPNNQNAFDHASTEQLMERYRAELLNYQRATPPGKPTLSQLHQEAPPRPTSSTTVSWPVFSTPASPPASVASAQSIPSAPTSRLHLASAAPPQPSPTPVAPPAAPPPSPPATLVITESVVAEQMQPTETDALLWARKMRTTLEESLLDLSQARGIRFGCAAGCLSVPEEQESNAPSRYRTLLPDEAAPLPTCACGIPQDTLPATLPSVPAEAPASAAPIASVVAIAAPSAPPAPIAPAVPIAAPSAPPAPIAPSVDNAQGMPAAPRPSIPPAGDLTKPAPPFAILGSPSNSPYCGHTEYEKGIGAYGTFRSYERWEQLTRAAFLQHPGEAIRVLARFAADVPAGGADACRCRRSFSVKFFCKGCEYDLLGQHLPVTVGCEQQAVLACCSANRADPSTGLRSHTRFWEYTVWHPIALHAAIWLYSDLGTIGSYRSIDGFCAPSIWAPACEKKRLVRCCWLSRQRPQTLTRFEAEELCGFDPDAVARDLVTAINCGEPVQYELAVQLLDPDQQYPFDPYDPTLIWPQELAPLQRLGLMTLDELPAQILPDLAPECFSSDHLIDGILLAPPALPAEGHELDQAGARLRGLGERERRRLIDNLCDELATLPAALLEQVLILFTKADLGFGQSLTAALGG